MTEKVINESGEVAVLYSPGYGAGWSSWNEECAPACLFHPEIVQMCLSGADGEAIGARAQEIWPEGYWGGSRDVRVMWIAAGTLFRIHEYDGSERIETRDCADWHVA